MNTKSKTVPSGKRVDNHSYLKANDNTEESKSLPHLQKPIKFLLK